MDEEEVKVPEYDMSKKKRSVGGKVFFGFRESKSVTFTNMNAENPQALSFEAADRLIQFQAHKCEYLVEQLTRVYSPKRRGGNN